MNSLTDACREGHWAPYCQPEEPSKNSFFSWLLMYNWTDRWRRDYVEHDGESAFDSYLEGYFNSFDFYPVCKRKYYEKNDAYALWLDFVKIAMDVDAANERLKSTPAQFLALGTITKDELETRKKEAEERYRQKVASSSSPKAR